MQRMTREIRNLTHAQELVTLRTGRQPAELLEDLYVRQGRSQEAIASELGVSRMTVAAWLREFGIVRASEQVA